MAGAAVVSGNSESATTAEASSRLIVSLVAALSHVLSSAFFLLRLWGVLFSVVCVQ